MIAALTRIANGVIWAITISAPPLFGAVLYFWAAGGY